ncbi:MAG: DUF3667 domain-containing protein [Erythrobacter sp.]
MTEIGEGIGGVVEAAMVGRAVEPNTGNPDDPSAANADTQSCANCSAPVSGNFCSNCGQKVNLHRTLSAIGHDLLHGVLHLDGKLWHTLPLLTFRPGSLTRRYIDGQRARFVSPMAMFLFSVFAMFAIFQMLGLSTPTDLSADDAIEQLETASVEALEAEEARLQSELDELVEGGNVTVVTSREDLERNLAVTQRLLGTARGEEVTVEDGQFDLRNLDVNLTGNEFFDNAVTKKWRENPSLMLYKLQANGYKFSWLLIPLSLPSVWLLFFWRRQFKAYDHAVFVTYSLAFMSLFFIALSLAGASGLTLGWGWAIFAIVVPLHIYKQLRGTYSLSRFSAIWRLFALQFSILFILLVFLQLLLLLGAF